MLDREPLFIGISVNSLEETFRLVTMGPSPEEKEKVLARGPLLFFVLLGSCLGCFCYMT
jgi:hypothetical protein